jgi:TrmH family RNA methyltransferase
MVPGDIAGFQCRLAISPGLSYNGIMSSSGFVWASRVTVILVRPQSGENIGLVARAMANTGFHRLRIVGLERMPAEAARTAVHAGRILKEARFFPSLDAAVGDLHILFAGTAKKRKKYAFMPLEEAVETMAEAPGDAGIGLVFGNERTGLTSAELQHTNFRFMIPQAGAQPSYNLAAAVLLTLFPLFIRIPPPRGEADPPLLNRTQQEECIRLILEKIDERGFIKPQSRDHIRQIVYDLFGRIVLTERDRGLLLALFSKGLD